GIRAAHPQRSRARGRGPPHEPHVRHRGAGGGLRHLLDPLHPPRRARHARAGRLRPGAGGAPAGLRDPRDRARSPLAGLAAAWRHPRAALGLMALPVVALHGIRVIRGARTVLDVPELTVEVGEVLAVIGPNGAGKSTLLRVMGLLETPTAGSVRFQGERVSPPDGLPVRRRMASVFQDPLLTDATVRDNVALGLRFRGADTARGAARITEWLEQLGIVDLAGRQARTLSGGEAQRTALARALVLEPELLLLDE